MTGHLTAWRMLFGKKTLQPGESVLIVGIGGGVAVACLQLAKLAGARGFVTPSSDAKIERAIAMGARGGGHHSKGGRNATCQRAGGAAGWWMPGAGGGGGGGSRGGVGA